MTLLDQFLRWVTAILCGYETVAITGKALDPNFPLPTITVLTHTHRNRRATYMLAGCIMGLLLHHLLIEGLDQGDMDGVARNLG